MSLKELRDELRNMRKETVKPVSKMRKGDIAAEIQRLKGDRETTPAVAAVPSTKGKSMKSAVESVKEAKAAEFPLTVVDTEVKKKAGKSTMAASKSVAASDAGTKKKGKKDMLKALLMAMESDSE